MKAGQVYIYIYTIPLCVSTVHCADLIPLLPNLNITQKFNCLIPVQLILSAPGKGVWSEKNNIK